MNKKRQRKTAFLSILGLILTIGISANAQEIQEPKEIQETKEIREIKETKNIVENIDNKYVDGFMGDYPQDLEDSTNIYINKELFDSNTIRLNTDIFILTETVVNRQHIEECFGYGDSTLYITYRENLNPLIPLALATCETGIWNNTNYTWTPAVYSKLLAEVGVDMNNLDVREVDADMYIANGLKEKLGCGINCTAEEGTHYHEIGDNDNDSLGPLQVLRRYIETEIYVSYKCNRVVLDLMCWEDSLNYYFHKQAEDFAKEDMWNQSFSIQNPLELVILSAIAHNTGQAFLLVDNGDSLVGSSWKDANAIFSFCEELTTSEALEIWKQYIDGWYKTIELNNEFTLAGQISEQEIDELLNSFGLEKENYAQPFGAKQYYPIKALLNYLSLERLYTSGNYK